MTTLAVTRTRRYFRQSASPLGLEVGMALWPVKEPEAPYVEVIGGDRKEYLANDDDLARVT